MLAIADVGGSKGANTMFANGEQIQDGPQRKPSMCVWLVVDRRKGANAQKEIDFVVNKGDLRFYIQSAWQIIP